MGNADHFLVRCPNGECGRAYRATADLVGKTVVCKSCGSKIRVVASASTGASPPAPAVRPDPAAPARPQDRSALHASNKTARSPSEAKHVAAGGPLSAGSGKVRTRCPGCGKVGEVPSAWQGRSIQCPACRQRSVVPRQAAAAAAMGAQGTSTASPPREPSGTKAGRSDSAEPADASADDLYGFAAEPPPAPPPVTSWTAPPADTSVYAPSGQARRKGEKDSVDAIERLLANRVFVTIAAGCVLLVVIGIGFAFPVAAFALRIVGGLVSMAGFVWALRIAFDEAPSCGILYLLDCTSVYRIYYTATRWSDMRDAFFAEVAGVLLCVPWVVRTAEDGWFSKPDSAIETEIGQGRNGPAWDQRSLSRLAAACSNVVGCVAFRSDPKMPHFRRCRSKNSNMAFSARSASAPWKPWPASSRVRSSTSTSAALRRSCIQTACS
jgi:DNA-directed RNA polymerase subunit RPC12/RpoP